MLDDVLSRAPRSPPASAGRMSAVTLHAITVLGHDRPGIIAETTAILAGLGLNLEDSSMTLLRGHFAMTLISAGDVPATAVAEALAPLEADGRLTVVGPRGARGGAGAHGRLVLGAHRPRRRPPRHRLLDRVPGGRGRRATSPT